MNLRFTKVEATGNDFVLLDQRLEGLTLQPLQAIALCDRHRGVGADGVLILERSSRAQARLTIWNADGSLAEMCGNGLRSAARRLTEILSQEEVSIETAVGVHRCRRTAAQELWVELLGLRVEPAETLTLDGRSLSGRAVRLGNPHFVLHGAALDLSEILGPQIERHPRFAPERTNVEFGRVVGDRLQLRVWERGVGPTLACGTGAAAAVAAAWAEGVLERRATFVDFPGGSVRIDPLSADRVGLCGAAHEIFSGEIALPAIG